MFATTWLRMRGSSDSATVRYNPGHRPNTRWVEALHCDSVTTQQLHLIKDPLHLHHISENELRALSQKDVIKSMNVFFHVDFDLVMGKWIFGGIYQESSVSGKHCFRIFRSEKAFRSSKHVICRGWEEVVWQGEQARQLLMHVDWALKCGLWVKPSLYLSAAVCN